MEKHPPEIQEQSSESPPLLTRIIRREQELESAVSACRDAGAAKIAAAREEAERLLESSISETGEKHRLLLAAAEEEARSEAESIRMHSLSRAESIRTDGNSGAAAVLEELLDLVLPPGEGGMAR